MQNFYNAISQVSLSAASPPATYKMARYVIFPTPEGTRRISLSCAIRPGAMTDRYSVTWKQILPFGSLLLLSANTQNITVDVNSTNATISTYQCNVIIQHSSDVSVSYFPPPVTIHAKGE